MKDVLLVVMVVLCVLGCSSVSDKTDSTKSDLVCRRAALCSYWVAPDKSSLDLNAEIVDRNGTPVEIKSVEVSSSCNGLLKESKGVVSADPSVLKRISDKDIEKSLKCSVLVTTKDGRKITVLTPLAPTDV